MGHLKDYRTEVEAFVNVCHELSSNNYVTGHGGNLAWKLSKNLLVLTPTQMRKADIGPDDVVFTDMDGRIVEGHRKPTGETPMYLNFFRERPDITSVIHCHAPMAGAFAITGGTNWLMRPVFPEMTIEVGPVPVVPYGEPLTQQLADNFLPYLKKANAFLMENHGLVVMSSKGIEWTMTLLELIETISVSLLHAAAIGPIKEICKAEVTNLDNTMKERKLPMFGAPGHYESLLDVYY